MYEVLLVEHNQVTTELLKKIITIKSAAWTYSYEAQLDWINRNLKDSDIHVLLLLDKNPVAYLNLIQIELKLDSITHEGFGIGNVCAVEKGKGWGKWLLRAVNEYIINNNKIGLLFCKNELIKFYSEIGWELVSSNNVFFTQVDSKWNTFVFNTPKRYTKLYYIGRSF